MTVVFIEARPRGASEGTPVDDYVIEDHADGTSIFWDIAD